MTTRRTDLRLPLGLCLALGIALGIAWLADAERARAAPTPSEVEARRFVEDTIDTVMRVLRDGGLSLEQKKDRVQSIAYERFDFALISRFVLARNWKQMTPQQQADFVEAFKQHLAATYRDTLDNYRDETIVIDSSRPESNGDVTVMTHVESSTGDTKVDYRLRQQDGAGWRGIDVIVEGVSLVQNFRVQAQEIISSEGADALIQKLRNKQINLEAGTKKG
jgi:phospholipid transport system substrate-binding protein